jgi:hypothetical protein
MDSSDIEIDLADIHCFPSSSINNRYCSISDYQQCLNVLQKYQ